MANHVNIYEIAELLDEEPFDMNWFSYDLGGGWGQKLTKYKKNRSALGTTTPGIGNNISINMVYNKLQNNDFTDIAGFYVGILAFFGEKIYENLTFVEKIPKNSINRVVSVLECPEKYKNHIYEICHAKYDFLDFISAASKLEKTYFDEESAISVYKLQGDEAIFQLLCQMFYNNKGFEHFSPSLIDSVPVHLHIDVSNHLSGCNFPVAVSPAVTNFKWEETQNGHYLYAEYKNNWCVLDAASVGRVNLSNYALTNRLNYLGGGGECLPYVICWNWIDIIDAYHYFGSDLLIRDLKNDLFNHYWFIFGLESLINVRFKKEYINFDSNFLVKPNFDTSLISLDKHASAFLTVNLKGDFVNYCEKKDVFYSDSEVFDWFELGKML